MSGQTLNDRLTAAKHTLAGQGLARIVCKATTEEVIGPKKKHLDHLLHCTNEPNVSIPQLANLLIERTQHSSWVVVFKALITVHHVMCYGNDRFTQYLASSNCTFQLGSFVDKCGVQGYDMSTFIRRYAKYLNEKAIAYRTVAFDFCKCKRGKEDGILRQMDIEKLLKTLPILQNQLDALLEFDCSSNDLTNGVVNSCFMLLFRDLIRLFACYNDGIINLLEKYFEMNKKHCRDALDIYKKFLIRMDRVAEFLKVAENVGIDKGEIPDLTKAPNSLLEALEQHLAQLEGRKGSTSAATVATRATNVKNAVSVLSHTSIAFGSAGDNATSPQEVNGIKMDETTYKAVEEEAEVMKQLKFDNESPLLWEQPAWEDSERRMKEVAVGDIITPPGGTSKTNPFLPSPAAEPVNGQTGHQGIISLFSEPTSPSGGVDLTSSSATNDLLSLNNNPFADSLFGGTDVPAQSQQAFSAFNMNGFGSATPTASVFATDESFAAAFGDSTPTELAAPFEAIEAVSPMPATPTAPASEKTTVKLNLPVLEPFGGRSTSPSPTTDLMRGAGTTPILSNPPDAFSDTVEGAEEPAPISTGNETPDFIWGNDSTPVRDSHQTSAHDPFGEPFEPPRQPLSVTPQPPTAVVPPLPFQTSSPEALSKQDLFGLDSNDFGDFGEQPTSAQPCAPPPSPFGGFDLSSIGTPGPDLRTQAIANAGGIPHTGMFAQQQQKASSGIDNLNFAIQKAMQGPGNVVSPGFSPSSAPITGIVNPAFGTQPYPPMGASLPPGNTPGSVPFNQLDSFGGGIAGTPSARASSTPGYCTPPSGLSSPAKSVASAGAFTTGNFDAFGDTLQPQTPSGKPISNDKPVSSSSSSSLLKGDLDSTLASLASNLDINGPKQSLKKTTGHQWGSPKPAARTTGPSSGWAGPPVGGTPGNMGWAASPQHGFQQPAGAPAGQWGGAGGAFPPQTGAAGLPQQPYMVGGIRPANQAPMGGMQMPVNMGMTGAPPSMPQQPQMFSGFSPQMSVPPGSVGMPSQSAPVNDPFGAL